MPAARLPRFWLIYPFEATDPLTPVVLDPFVSGDVAEGHWLAPLSLYQTDPPLHLTAIKDASGGARFFVP